MTKLRKDALKIVEASIEAVLPEKAVRDALQAKSIDKEVSVIAIGKAAWRMANAAFQVLGDQIRQGLIITKYDHSQGPIPNFKIIEAGHPIPDENSVTGASKALKMVSSLDDKKDFILFLVSGGGSALFELPQSGLTLEDVIGVTDLLLSRGADIKEMNTVRKHLSRVKGGRFAEACGTTELYAVVLSDVIGDPLDVIASGPAFPDPSTSEEAFKVLDKFDIYCSAEIKKAIENETPKALGYCDSVVTGSVTKLCDAAASVCEALGYPPFILSTEMTGEASELGRMMSSIAREILKGTKSPYKLNPPCAIIAGGETIVHLKGKGKGGRNQETALAAAFGIQDLEHVVIFSVGSDGTDGPTDAAGGMVDGKTLARIRSAGFNPSQLLAENDSYHALEVSGDLVITGPTGTNVNDLMVVLIKENV
ncbi:glycerate kinase type-2 family protein [Acidaminobacter hydrogenoformans]|uniref:Glycerate 2-kinase n=1 Tax=Acidaminobacter hydrogenoformans DSM 2784 TaxID=1120920 RepID=A0A1G5S2C4_9FIRM|nr:glycerate kinase [Acidaminobacter hydrogenoformans]SCZ79901.1 glycerate 2-kinase [Acidaminobacter hydrogenoformans DSM 2784]